MGLKKYKLGEYIERSTANNHSLKYKEESLHPTAWRHMDTGFFYLTI